MVDFMEKLYSIEVPDLHSLLRNENFISTEKVVRLSEVDNITLNVGVQFFRTSFLGCMLELFSAYHTYKEAGIWAL